MDCIVHGVAKSRTQLSDSFFKLLQSEMIVTDSQLNNRSQLCIFQLLVLLEKQRSL